MTAAQAGPQAGPYRSRAWLRRATRPLLALALGLALAGVFAAYLNPHLVVDLANRVWSCF